MGQEKPSTHLRLSRARHGEHLKYTPLSIVLQPSVTNDRARSPARMQGRSVFSLVTHGNPVTLPAEDIFCNISTSTGQRACKSTQSTAHLIAMQPQISCKSSVRSKVRKGDLEPSAAKGLHASQSKTQTGPSYQHDACHTGANG